MNAIKTVDLTYKYSRGMPDEVVAVDSISAEVEKGEFLGIIGHTGSGKSTFIQMLNGLLKPTSGKVYINGQDIFESKESLKKRGLTSPDRADAVALALYEGGIFDVRSLI